jgi:hypothetical protein
MLPGEVAPLPRAVPPDERESAAGYLFRAALANSTTLPAVWSALGLGRGRAPRAEQAKVLAWYTQSPADWLSWRVPVAHRLDGQARLDLFGQPWRRDGHLRRSRAQHCPVCLRSRTLIPFEWDLLLYCACPAHGVILQDMCAHCGRSVDLFRPGWDVCACRHYLVSRQEAPIVAETWTQHWCEWVSHALKPDVHAPPAISGELRRLLDGLSVDGAGRFVVAFGGGQRSLATERLSASQPWLTPQAVARVVSVGMRNLAVLSETGRLPTGWPKPAVDDLMSVAAHGLISTDRGRAAWLIERINGRPRARRAYRTGPLQLDLFDVSRHQG